MSSIHNPFECDDKIIKSRIRSKIIIPPINESNNNKTNNNNHDNHHWGKTLSVFIDDDTSSQSTYIHTYIYQLTEQPPFKYFPSYTNPF